MTTKGKELPHQQLHIRNKKKFTIFLLLILCTSFAIFIPKLTKSEINYQKYTVAYGDTYWQIAKSLQKQGYKSRADVREIVGELISKSGIKAHELKAGDMIYIPDWRAGE